MPAPKPAFDAALDSGNSLTTGIEFASWCVEDEANPTRLTDVSGNALHGTLTNLDPGYQLAVTGGTGGNAAYNQTYTPAGSEYGKTKYVSADSNYKLSFWYMMDPEMDGAWYLWAAAGTDPSMDGYVSYKSGNVSPWGGTWSSSFAVGQGNAYGPWFDDGLELTTMPGYVSVTTNNDIEPGTGNFSIVFDYTYKNTTSEGQATVLFEWSGGGKMIRLYRWPDDNTYWSNSGLRLYITDGTNSTTIDFTPSRSAWTLNQRNVVEVVFVRNANATCYLNGSSVGSGAISSVSGSLSGMGTLLIGTLSSYGSTWSFAGRMHTALYWKGVAHSSTQAATIAADIYDLAAGESSPTGRPMYLLQQLRQPRSQSTQVRFF